MPVLIANADYVTEWQCTYSSSSSDCIAAATTTDAIVSSTTAQAEPYVNYSDTVLMWGVIVFLLMFTPLTYLGSIFRPRDKLIKK